jgi:hypothetical protein
VRCTAGQQTSYLETKSYTPESYECSQGSSPNTRSRELSDLTGFFLGS